jgi:hypothetical protein
MQSNLLRWLCDLSLGCSTKSFFFIVLVAIRQQFYCLLDTFLQDLSSHSPPSQDSPLSSLPANNISLGENWLHSDLRGEIYMWIFDSYFKGCVELWRCERGLVSISAAYPPSFCMHLKDPHVHWEMIQALESRFRVEECSFNTIFGTSEGHRIYASRKVVEKIEMQTKYAASFTTWMSGIMLFGAIRLNFIGSPIISW